MSLEADYIVDRRRMRRKLTFWRVFAVLLAICAVVALGVAMRVPGTGLFAGEAGASIARVTITGLIRTDRERVAALDRLSKSEKGGDQRYCCKWLRSARSFGFSAQRKICLPSGSPASNSYNISR